MTRRVLHISDLHLPAIKPEPAFDLEFLLEHIGVEAPLDAVLITGDLADHGSFADTGARILRQVRQLVRTPRAVCIVPGNHDVRFDLRERRSDKQYYEGKFRGFREHIGTDFTSALLPTGDDAGGEPSGFEAAGDGPVFVDDRSRMAVLCLNSAIHCGEVDPAKEQEIRSRATRDGWSAPAAANGVDPWDVFRACWSGDRPEITQRQIGCLRGALDLERAKRPAWGDYLKVAILHHHVKPFRHDADRKAPFDPVVDARYVLDFLEQEAFDVVLTGHKHNAYLEKTSVFDEHGTRREMIYMGAGTAGGALPPHCAHLVHYVEIEQRRNGLEVRCRDLALGLHNGPRVATTGIRRFLEQSTERAASVETVGAVAPDSPYILEPEDVIARLDSYRKASGADVWWASGTIDGQHHPATGRWKADVIERLRQRAIQQSGSPGDVGLILLEGVPGVGKSCLLMRYVAQASEHGVDAFLVDFEGNRRYAPSFGVEEFRRALRDRNSAAAAPVLVAVDGLDAACRQFAIEHRRRNPSQLFSEIVEALLAAAEHHACGRRITLVFSADGEPDLEAGGAAAGSSKPREDIRNAFLRPRAHGETRMTVFLTSSLTADEAFVTADLAKNQVRWREILNHAPYLELPFFFERYRRAPLGERAQETKLDLLRGVAQPVDVVRREHVLVEEGRRVTSFVKNVSELRARSSGWNDEHLAPIRQIAEPEWTSEFLYLLREVPLEHPRDAFVAGLQQLKDVLLQDAPPHRDTSALSNILSALALVSPAFRITETYVSCNLANAYLRNATFEGSEFFAVDFTDVDCVGAKVSPEPFPPRFFECINVPPTLGGIPVQNAATSSAVGAHTVALHIQGVRRIAKHRRDES